MARRLFAILAVVAMVIAYLPGVLNASSASHLPDCCNGVMCPMHRVAAGQVDCGTGGGRRDGQLKSCADLSQHYAATLVFLRTAPALIWLENLLQSAPMVRSSVAAKTEAEVPYPPPRLLPFDK